MMKVKYYKCPNCEKKFKTLTGWGNHMKTNHPESFPEGYSVSRFFYYTVTGRTSGTCRTCKGETPWNEKSMKYDQYCTNPECKKAYVKIAKQRMIGKYGKAYLLNDPEMQKKMLQNRGISGKYKFKDGVEFDYVGSYERNFLQMLDTLFEWHSNDVIAPSPHTYYYEYKNSVDTDNEGRKFYIPDFYIPSLNLEIEIKQQTSTNEKFNEINRVKEKLKDDVMKSNPNVNYLKINDNNFESFFQFLMKAQNYIPTNSEIKKNQMDLVVEANTTLDNYGLKSDLVYYDEIDYNDDIVFEQAQYSVENRYPVFIILMHSGTLLANTIKAFTKDEFSHACISFNSNLDPMYSFGNKKVSKMDPGFVVQNPTSDFYKKHDKTYYSVYVMYVNKKSYDLMQKGLQEFIDKKDELKYDLKSLISVWKGKESENSEKYFCSRFVMEIIGRGMKLDKVPSLWRPQEISTLQNISLVNKGVNFYNYDPSITNKNLLLIKSDQFDEIAFESYIDMDNSNEPLTNESNTNFYDIANEGFLSLFGIGKSAPVENHHVDKWEKTFQLDSTRNLFGSIFTGVKIENGMIEIHGINYATLKGRIKRFYQDKSIFNIFIPQYNAMSYKKFEKKKIQRSAIKIDYLYTPEFFALELVSLFIDLGKRFRDKNYLSMASVIYNKSWLKQADQNVDIVPYLSTKNLQNLSLSLNGYQKEFIEKYPKLKAQLNLNGYILAFEQGLGKTLTAIALAECLEVDHVYIVCPNSLKENWALELQKYYIKYQEDEDLWRQEVFICTGKSIFFNEHTTKFIITNNESIQKMYPYVMRGKNMLILDESHMFRNVKSKRTQEILELRDKLKCVDTLVMSGTPIKATPDEIVPALMLIDPTLTEQASDCFSKAFKLHSSLGTSLVQTRFGKVIYRKQKDVLENTLPEKIIQDFEVQINDSDKYIVKEVTAVIMDYYHALYQTGVKSSLALSDEFFTITKRYTSRPNSFRDFSRLVNDITKDPDLYLHEIDKLFVENYMKDVTSRISDRSTKDRYVYLIKNYVRYRNHCLGVAFGAILPKYRRNMFISMYDENRRIFFDMINNNTKKTLIFSQFKDVANHIHEDLNANNIGAVIITGDVKDRLSVLKAFKEEDSVRVLVATSQTLGTGVTLTEASQMFFFGPPWRQSDFDQCSDRIHRIGQTDDCYIYTVTLDTGSELNLSTRMDNILDWSKKMTEAVITTTEDDEDIDRTNFENILKADESFLFEESKMSISNESLVFSRKPIRYKVEDFDSGKSNVLLVTGLSGSGKSTIGESYMKKDSSVEWVELDWFEKNYGMSDSQLKECSEPLFEYLTKTPTGIAFREASKSNNKPRGEDLRQSIKVFGDWLLNYCSTHRKTKWVIEGVQIYSCFDFEKVKKYPIIIVGTSMTKSIVRRLKRDGYEKEFIKMCQWYYDEEKNLNSFRNAIVNEGFFSELSIEVEELINEFLSKPSDDVLNLPIDL